MLFRQFLIYLIFTIDQLTGKHCFYIVNHHFYLIIKFTLLIIDLFIKHILSLLFSFYNFFVLIDNWSKVKTFLQRLLFWVDLCPTYFKGNFIWSFSFYLIIISCWLVCSCWLYQRSLIWVVARVPVGCNWVLTSINAFYWSRISFKFINQDFLCWLLNYLFWIHWIGNHWYWNLSSGVLHTKQWNIYRL